MKNIKRVDIGLLIALACLAAAGGAHGATRTQTQVVAASASGSDFLVPFAQFDPALGVLTGATLTVDETTTGYTYVENLSADPIFVSPFGQGSIHLDIPTIDALTGASGWSSAAVLLSGFDGLADFDGVDSLYGSGSNSTTRTDVFPASGPLSSFIGTNFLYGEVTVSQYTGLDHGLYVNTLYYNVVSGDVSLTYTYTPVAAVPEPTSWALMLLGVSGIGAALRGGRRRTLRHRGVTPCPGA